MYGEVNYQIFLAQLFLRLDTSTFFPHGLINKFGHVTTIFFSAIS